MMSGVSVHHGMLIAAFIAFAQDLSGGVGVARAWTYNYSTSPIRRWSEARQWCRQHFTDMVAVRSQEESDYVNGLLPFTSRYYWIGVRKEDGGWIWDSTDGKVPESDQNWAPGEPDDIAGQDCVEMYVKRGTDTAKWNNENCRKKKGTACFSESCTQDSCGPHADCVETIGNYTCQCHPGFSGSVCEEAIACEPLLQPGQGSHYCFHPYGSNRFNSSCHFYCELGFQLIGVHRLRCQASGSWDHPVPRCRVEQCPLLNHTEIGAGSMNCSHPIAPYSYNSTCEVTCDKGYEPNGPHRIHCDHTGQWTDSVPACSKKKCSPILFPSTGNVTCSDASEPFSFGSRCGFTCQEGYHLTGDGVLDCLASGQWSKPLPTCSVVRCDSLTAPPNGSMQCHGPLGDHSFGSTCALQCEEGFDLIGTNLTKCSSGGNWSHARPVCQVKRCNPINPSPHGSLSCSDPNGSFSFGSLCTTTCDQGFVLNGTASNKCNSLGAWSADTPLCFAKRCPSVSPPSHGSFSCSGPYGGFSFGSGCTSTCEEGFVLNGTAHTECMHLGSWSTDIPHCLAKRCPSVSPPSHGSLSCSGPYGEFSFGSGCTFTCEEGFVLDGTADTECTALGMWSAEIPQCLAHPCPLLAKAPQYGRMNCSHPHSPFSYGSHCEFECTEGFWLKGTQTMSCNRSGHWSQGPPTCQPMQCGTVRALPSSLSMNCTHPVGNFSFGSRCLFTCKEGFSLNGTQVLFCSSTGSWSDGLPRCIAEGLPMGTAMLIYTGVGASSAFVLLALIGLALLIITRFKKTANMSISDPSAWGDRDNPTFEF